MKSKKLYTKLLLAGSLIACAGVMTSCDDYLTLLPTDKLPEESFWQDKADLDGVRAGAYDQLAASGQTTKILQWGELRSDNLTLNNVSNTTIDNLQNAVLQPSNSMFDWSGFYTGINYCNLVIEKGEDMTTPGEEIDPSFTRSDYNVYLAEMTALRSLYYFYLVRSFRDVPYITHSIRTDAEARASHPAATPGVAILGDCIKQMEATVNYAADNFGSDSENRGRFTKIGVKSLLADMYLWRACMLKDYVSKGTSEGVTKNINIDDVAITDADGNVTGYKTYGNDGTDGQDITDSYCNNLVKECLQKSKDYAQQVIDKLKEEYDKDMEESNSTYTEEERTQPYPLYLNNRNSTSITDVPYNNNFNLQNSNESVLELQYDGSTVTNSTVNSYFSTYANNQFTPGIMTLSNNLISQATSVDPEIGYGKTDLRLLETCYYPSSATSKPVIKFVLTSFTISNTEDLVSSNVLSNFSGRTSSSNNAHWPIYRLTDLMLIKAEAIARLGIINNSIDLADLQEGFRLVNLIFKRNNPALVTPSEAESNPTKKTNSLYSERLTGDAYCTSNNKATKTASDLLSNVYRERQREFVGEGKRWYDIVRQAEYSYVANDLDNSNALSFGSFKSTVTGRLKKIYALYNPIYSEELKVNGVGQADGGQLVQNPVWDRYTKK